MVGSPGCWWRPEPDPGLGSTAASSGTDPVGSSTSVPATADTSTSSVDSSIWNAPGSKSSRRWRPKGRARGYDVLEGTLEAADLTDHVGRYDVVSMNHVLEHVVDPRTMLERARDLLRPGGRVIGQLPTVTSWENKLFGRNWGGYHYPRHLQIPSKVGLADLLEDVGLDDVKIRSAPHIQTTISLQNSLVRRGWRPRMQNGKTPIYTGLLVAALPYETVAWLCDEGGIIDFQARKPVP